MIFAMANLGMHEGALEPMVCSADSSFPFQDWRWLVPRLQPDEKRCNCHNQAERRLACAQILGKVEVLYDWRRQF